MQDNQVRPGSGGQVHGICVECGTLILEERLSAVPGALRCSDCQAVYETEVRTPLLTEWERRRLDKGAA